MSPSVTSMAVICDWPLLRLGLVQAIDSQSDLQITASFSSVREALREADETKVVLIALQVSDQVASDQVAQLARQGRAVIVLSTSQAQSDAVLCIKAGARAYLSRQTEVSELVAAVRAVASGRSYLGASLAGHSLPTPPPHLTGRERQILQLVANGATDREIAAKLNITENTVHTHLERLRRKIGSRRRADLTRLALRYGGLGDFSAE
ncbi:response regulator transcription factor [Streptomyces sp. SID161]|uniref:response regulator transcription factor n=1 Tax=unclassified Streptomyces TaxID=2593676 RepID=UPI00136AC765|nr:response regulator transcription factor [Streptomyces sp. SID161]MYW17662.1 winged helix-turn-helix transcriptional regulator [Streptomyces sp. SID2955]MYW47569.1 winged helix-turn-helix transcriptional regulator [Streptomyces sp. SID161]